MTLTAISDKGVVAAPHRLAAETGRAILQEGGNALEACIAMGATIAVTYPHMSGLGGDGLFMIREPDGRVGYIEACGPAGAGASHAAYRKMGHDVVPPRGPLAAATIPGVAAGWTLAREAARGRLPLKVLCPARRTGLRALPMRASTTSTAGDIGREMAADLEAIKAAADPRRPPAL